MLLAKATLRRLVSNSACDITTHRAGATDHDGGSLLASTTPRRKRDEKHEKNILDPDTVVACHGTCQQRFIRANKTRSDYLFL
jgi:hypothetical protein